MSTRAIPCKYMIVRLQENMKHKPTTNTETRQIRNNRKVERIRAEQSNAERRRESRHPKSTTEHRNNAKRKTRVAMGAVSCATLFVQTPDETRVIDGYMAEQTFA